MITKKHTLLLAVDEDVVPTTLDERMDGSCVWCDRHEPLRRVKLETQEGSQGRKGNLRWPDSGAGEGNEVCWNLWVV